MSRTNSCGPYCPLNAMYGPQQAQKTFAWLETQIQSLSEAQLPPFRPLDQRFAILTAAPNQVHSPADKPLRALARLVERVFGGHFQGIELLNFFTAATENSAGVIDFEQVDPRFGDWQDVEALQNRFDLMVHLPLNHVSVQHAWFQKFLSGQTPYDRYFYEMPADSDLSLIDHPSPNALLSRVRGANGEKWVWTTYGSKLPDLNYASPQLLSEMITVLMALARRRIRMIRLEDVSYLWKEPGTNCHSLAQSHGIVHLFQDILQDSGTQTLLAADVDAPFQEALSYFGGGGELHLLENSALPALTLHAFETGSAAGLRHWAAALRLPAPQVTFLNVLDLPQGVALEPARDLLGEDGIAHLVTNARMFGVLVSERPDAQQHTLKSDRLVASFWDALRLPDEGDIETARMRRYLTAWSLCFSLVGVPVVNLHSLFAPILSGRVDFRDWRLLRPALSIAEAEALLSGDESPAAQIWLHIQKLLALRADCAAFHPYSAQMVLDTTGSVLALLRIAPDGRSTALCLYNFSEDSTPLELDLRLLGFKNNTWRDLLSGERLTLSPDAAWKMPGSEAFWLVPDAI